MEALHDELSKRDDQFKRANERGRLAFIKDYVTSKEEEEEDDEEEEEQEKEGIVLF